MIRKKLLNFTLYQIMHYYGHIDGFTRDASPKLNFFLFGVYYNLNIFQIYYSISFLKTFFFIYNNVTIKGLPSLLISSINLFKKKTISRFLQYYSFGNWTYGLFSNWLYCKSFLNITKYPFLNRKIKTIPRIIVGLNNNFFLEREIKNTYTSIISFTFVNSSHFDAKRYFAPYNTDSIISLNFYLKIFYLLHDRSSLIKLHFFWSFSFLQKISQGKLLKIFFKIFKKRGFFIRPHYKQKNYLKKRRRALRRYQLRVINQKVAKYPIAAYFDPIFRVFGDRIRIAKLVVGNRVKLGDNLLSHHPLLTEDDRLFDPLRRRRIANKRQSYKFFSKNKKIQYFLKKKYKKKSVNFIFNYFKLLLILLVKEKYLDDTIFESYAGILQNNFLIKIKKLVIFKIFLRYQKFLLSRYF